MHTQVLYENDTLEIGARIARANRLFVPGWTLSEVYRDIETFNREAFLFKSKMAIYFIDNYPVAIATCVWPERHFMAFTRSAYRKNGYAKTLINMILNSEPETYFANSFATHGVEGSEKFWKLFENHFPNHKVR